MTAELIIMNKNGIALAADSAVTIGGLETTKIFPSANKLFALSKMHPVGVMIYQNAEFMGVPWETIIKMYRKEIGNEKYDTLEEYADSLLKFLVGANTIKLIPINVQEAYMYGCINSYLESVIKDSFEDEKLRIESECGEEIDSDIEEKIISDIVREQYEVWSTTENIPSMPESFNQDILIKYGEKISDIISYVFQGIPISSGSVQKLKEIASFLFSKYPKTIENSLYTGIVIAGFGDKEYFPVIKAFSLESIIMDKLKYKTDLVRKIDFDNLSGIYPFAQRDMIDAFMRGVDSKYKIEEFENIQKSLESYKNIFIEILEKYNINDQTDIQKCLIESKDNITKQFIKQMSNHQRESHIEPITNIVSILPKDELALMAETLVNLTSFKRKISEDAETVGGPIDVAVISKGDGFIWIKRKHYFKPELNTQYFINRYRGAIDD